MGGYTPHAYNLTYLPHWGLTLYLTGWEDQSLSQGIAPRSGAGRRGRYRGEGPTSGVTSTFDQVLLLWPLSPRPSSWTPTLEVVRAGALWVPFYCPSQGWGFGLGSQ